jgi:hypothetical protein
VAHQDGALDAHFIQEAAQVLGHIGGGVASGGDVAVAVAAEVVGGDAVLAAQDGRHVEVPDGQIAEEAVQHDNIGARADSDVMQIHPVSFYLRHRSERQPPYSM